MHASRNVVAVLIFLAAGVSSNLLAQNVVVVPSSDQVSRDLDEMIKRHHEEAMQRRQFEHEEQMQREAIAAAKQIATPAPAVNNILVPVSQVTSYTDGHANGRLWRQLDTSQRLLYLIAFSDAATGDASPSACDCTLDEVADGITAFYAVDPAFSPIPISFAVRLYGRRARGATTDEIVITARGFLRYLASQAPAKQ